MSPPATPCLEVLVFEIEGQRVALASSGVLEITRAVTVTPLPHAPAIVEGIINLRGSVVPVLDVRSRFGFPARRPVAADHFIVAMAGPRRVVLRVDRALDLARIPASAIMDVGSIPGGKHVAGVAKTEDGLVLIHDLGTFLSDAEGGALDGAIAVAEGAGA